jgi:hypothetical protein
MTCITSNADTNQGVNPSSKGDSEGPLFREGAYFEMYNSLVTSNNATMGSNECVEIEDTEGPETIDAAQAGTSIAIGNVIACSEAVKTGIVNAANAGFNFATWLAGGDGSAQIPLNSNANNVVESANLPANLIDGGVGTRGYLTAASLTNSLTNVIFDQSGTAAPGQLFDVATLGSIFETPTYVGAANAGDDWLAGWTVGLTGPLP